MLPIGPTITRNETVSVQLKPFYVRMPGCHVTSDEKRRIKLARMNKDELVIEDYPDEKFHFKRTGIINRNQETVASNSR